ncbi:hypothetical protein [Ferruginibacter profundus]
MMKLLVAFTILFSIAACAQNTAQQAKMTVNIYIAGCDSIFYCEGETFNAKAIQASKSNDSVFVNKMLYDITKENKKVLFKPFGGNCGDGNLGERVMNVKSLLISNNIEFTISNTDSVENNYFNDVSVIDMLSNLRPPPPPPAVVVVTPTISSTKDESPFFQFILNPDGSVYYSYDSTDMNRNLILIDQPGKEKLIAAINTVEQKNKITLSDGQIIIRGPVSAKYAQFKIIKDALRAKDIYKFKIVTTDENALAPLKKQEQETPIPITNKTLTLVLSSTGAIFYYHGTDCSGIKKTSLQQLHSLLINEKRNTPVKELMIIIKQEAGGSFKTAVDVLDEIILAKIPAKQSAEMDITASEIKCIKNFTTK